MLPCANGVQFLDGSEFGVMDSMVDPEPILAIRKASPDDALAARGRGIPAATAAPATARPAFRKSLLL